MDISNSNPEAAVSFSNLGHAYVPDTWIFRRYHASVRKGEIFAILGPNGRGKTTLLKILLGAIQPCEGTLQIDGDVAFVPQLFQVSFDFSCLDMVLMGRARKVGLFTKPKASDLNAASAALERLGIAHFAELPFHQLSGGQRQLVIFARAIAAEADILVLDEPTSALDLQNQQQVLRWIYALSRQDGLTVLMTTHHPHHALAVADQALLMLGCDRFDIGPAKHVLTKEALSALYNVTMARARFQHRDRSMETLVPVFEACPDRTQLLETRGVSEVNSTIM